jgi:oligoendopeptidase F
MSVACVVANKILNNDTNILNRYKEFLSCGSNLHPMEIFEKLNIDLRDENIYEQAVKYFDSKLELYNELNKEGE